MKSSILSMEQMLKTKHHLRGAESRSEKPHQHRYERRKMRQVLRYADFGMDEEG